MENLGWNLVSNAIWAMGIAIYVFSRRRLGRLNRRAVPTVVHVCLLFFAIATAAILWLRPQQVPLWKALLPAVPMLLGIVVLYSELWRFWNVGLRGADRSIESGLNYDRALRLTQNRLEFLGTGASKLTNSPEFEAALTKAGGSGSACFLLLDPEAHVLIEAAKQSGKPQDAYKERVLESLRKIAILKRRKELNVEVRLYSERQLFRMMFIDQLLCLVSFNAYGEGDGSQLPQLQVAASAPGDRNSESFYFAFKKHFDLVWEKSKLVNLENYE